MKKFPSKFQRIAGFTLIELMIASAIGTFLLAGVFTVFSNGRQTQGAIEAQTQLVDDGRFAIRTLYYDLRHAGLWGQTNNYSKMAGALGVDAKTTIVGTEPVMPGLSGDCKVGWYRDLKESFFVANNINPYSASCIPNGEYRLNTDVLVVKYAPPTPIDDASLAADTVYVYSNNFEGQLFVGPPAPTWKQGLEGQSPKNYVLRARAYFVNEFTDYNGDGYPSLHRIALATGPSLVNTMMIPGVEDFQIQLGLDTNGDGAVNMYVDADNPEVGPEMAEVKSVQFWVMLRSRDKEFKAGEIQNLSMAGRVPVEYKDGYRRAVVSSVVKLKNRPDLVKKAGS